MLLYRCDARIKYEFPEFLYQFKIFLVETRTIYFVFFTILKFDQQKIISSNTMFYGEKWNLMQLQLRNSFCNVYFCFQYVICVTNESPRYEKECQNKLIQMVNEIVRNWDRWYVLNYNQTGWLPARPCVNLK